MQTKTQIQIDTAKLNPCGYCRRCLLHDDPAGCLEVQAYEREIFPVLHAQGLTAREILVACGNATPEQWAIESVEWTLRDLDLTPVEERVSQISTRTLQYDAESKTFHGYLTDTGLRLARVIGIESGRTGTVVEFEFSGDHWSPDHEGEPDGWFNYHLYRALDGDYTLKIWNSGSIKTETEIPSEPWGRVLGGPVVIVMDDDPRDLDPDLAREAYEEMQMEGEVIAREEAECMGWSAAFEDFGGRL